MRYHNVVPEHFGGVMTVGLLRTPEQVQASRTGFQLDPGYWDKNAYANLMREHVEHTAMYAVSVKNRNPAGEAKAVKALIAQLPQWHFQAVNTDMWANPEAEWEDIMTEHIQEVGKLANAIVGIQPDAFAAALAVKNLEKNKDRVVEFLNVALGGEADIIDAGFSGHLKCTGEYLTVLKTNDTKSPTFRDAVERCVTQGYSVGVYLDSLRVD